MNIKASGGISNFKKAMKFISIGVNRIGTSNGVKLMKEFKKQDK